VIELPLFVDTPRYTMTVLLSGVSFGLLYDYNGREDRWYVSVFEADGVTPVWRSRKIVPGVPPLLRCRTTNRPAGTIFYSGQSDPPRFAELGRTVRCLYDPDTSF
jgi:hypothetical protein